MADSNPPEERELYGTQSISGKSLLARLFWLAGGNVALLAIAALILRDNHPALSAMSAIYWALVGALVGVRYLDVTRLGGLTSDGKPATISDFRRYGVKLLAFAGALWVVVLAL